MTLFNEVKVYPQTNSTGSSKLLARGSFVVSGAVKVNFAYVNGSNGPFVSLPQDKVSKDGETNYYPHAKFISKEAVAEISKLVAAEYENVKNGGGTTASTVNNTSAVVADDELPF